MYQLIIQAIWLDVFENDIKTTKYKKVESFGGLIGGSLIWLVKIAIGEIFF